MNFEGSETLQTRLKALLPEQYRERLDAVQPVSMGSAGLKYGSDGNVAWDKIWGSFCDLAMAGGPPHRGTLLEPASGKEIAAEPELYREAEHEICRGIHQVTGLHAVASPHSGWVRMYCTSAAMAGWLARAIVMENIAARFQGLALYLPAGPRYRVEKQIKNVVTSVAKTCHYWIEHMSDAQHQEIADTLRAMEQHSPLVQPVYLEDETELPSFEHAAEHCGTAIHRATGLRSSCRPNHRWLGVECVDVPQAVCLMRLLVASNVMSRREGTSVLLPIDPATDPEGQATARIFQIACSHAAYSDAAR